jgi:phosphoribosyl 1,2-cyclic phosphodiesterase
MRFCSLASGSSGNSYYVGTSATHLIVDAGISRKRIVDRLSEIDVGILDVDGVLITHEHSDHTAGLKVLAKHANMPFYATRGTIEYLLQQPGMAHISRERFVEIQADKAFTIGDISVRPFSISHDAAEPVAFALESDKRKMCICTDLGTYTQHTAEELEGSEVLVLEANHDINLLRNGPYPAYLKARIAGQRGHLSNDSSGRLLSSVLHSRMEAVFLGHLSAVNNNPVLAVDTVRKTVGENAPEFSSEAGDIPLFAAPRNEKSMVVEW